LSYRNDHQLGVFVLKCHSVKSTVHKQHPQLSELVTQTLISICNQHAFATVVVQLLFI